ncbi:ribbon-helix-helix domain-containing protein [Nitrosospira briensis]|uniref:ribbon-helix-helix domain-containing protein n=1 Tax=Nitrosospira briensis TaxID=35799 RepID=UPI0008E688FB|nr:ribbon-helix-helix domain-containing protein [Nitrosospira briensis]SFO38645.1 CopG-like RHH_1 or ribbon-helix-helix domain-containing protein, RHH_5 [Nitrosospira briensis]
MTSETSLPAKPKPEPKSTRASVSFPRELYDTVEQLAAEKKVSVAWIVRDAVEKYVADQWPLFADEKRKNPSV